MQQEQKYVEGKRVLDPCWGSRIWTPCLRGATLFRWVEHDPEPCL